MVPPKLQLQSSCHSLWL